MQSLRPLKKQPTDLEIEKRQSVLADVILKIQTKNNVVVWQHILKEMKRSGYPEYTRMMLYTDRTALNSKNNYIRNFLPNYSAFQEEIAINLDWVINEAKRNYNKKWTQSIQTVRETKDGKFKIQTIKTELAGPKKMFLDVVLKAVDLQQQHAGGQNVQIAAVVIQKELQDKKKIIKGLEFKVLESKVIKDKAPVKKKQ